MIHTWDLLNEFSATVQYVMNPVKLRHFQELNKNSHLGF